MSGLIGWRVLPERSRSEMIMKDAFGWSSGTRAKYFIQRSIVGLEFEVHEQEANFTGRKEGVREKFVPGHQKLRLFTLFASSASHPVWMPQCSQHRKKTSSKSIFFSCAFGANITNQCRGANFMPSFYGGHGGANVVRKMWNVIYRPLTEAPAGSLHHWMYLT